jgi:hypothetical protein
MSILRSTYSGRILYWENTLLSKGYYRNPKYKNFLIHPNDTTHFNVPDHFFNLEETGVTVYIIVGNWGKRVHLVDIEHLKMIEDYWAHRKNWTEAESVELAKQLGKEIIHYADTH